MPRRIAIGDMWIKSRKTRLFLAAVCTFFALFSHFPPHFTNSGCVPPLSDFFSRDVLPIPLLMRKSRMIDHTKDVIVRQAHAMASEVFEVGLYKPAPAGAVQFPEMLLRTWDLD